MREDKSAVADGLATIEEAMEFVRVSRATIYALMDRGQLTYTKIGRRRLIPRQALIQLAEGGLVRAFGVAVF
jgi:excisionase family DNA binding protein